MRTTLDLDPAVLRVLRARAKRDGKSMGRLASEVLASALGDQPPPRPEPLRWTTRAMRARVDLDDPEAVRRALEST